jgi:integration host factor subunit beta
MVKSELIQALAKRNQDLPFDSLELLVSLAFETMAEMLVNRNDIEIRGFGSFRVKQQNSRWARNPKNGQLVFQPVHRVIHFKAGKEVKELIHNHR